MKRKTFEGLLQVAIVCILALGAGALLAQTITPDSPCGERATGRRIDGRITTEQAPGWHVDRDGGWTTCQMPAQADRGCQVPAQTWQWAGVMCTAPAGPPLGHGMLRMVRTRPGPVEGLAVLQCTDGAVSIRVSTCNATLTCEASSYEATDDGGVTTWRWSGRLREGERSTATSGDGDARLIECKGGALRLL